MDNFIAEIRIFPFYFAPDGWAFCDGQIIPISQNTALFSLLGTAYGGNGINNFALPNLQGSAPLAAGECPELSWRDVGESGGQQAVTLLTTELPSHKHNAIASSGGGQTSPKNNAWGAAAGFGRPPALYAPSSGSNVQMSAAALAPAGGSSPHNNMMPFLTLNFCIALQGIFPSRG